MFIILSYTIVYYMKFEYPICRTYDAKTDDFKIWILIIPCFMLSLVFNVTFTIFEILYAFSIFLEVELYPYHHLKYTSRFKLYWNEQSVSIIPQLFMIWRYVREWYGSIHNITNGYVFCLGAYRVLYIVNWVYRYWTEPGYYDPIVWLAGVIQTLLYIDFYYYYSIGQRYNSAGLVIPF